jgi:hypothetical protein
MKKILVNFLVISIFAVAALADDGDDALPTCVAGHINSPGVTCQPPDNNRVTTEETTDDSAFAAISRFFTEYNLFENL